MRTDLSDSIIDFGPGGLRAPCMLAGFSVQISAWGRESSPPPQGGGTDGVGQRSDGVGQRSDGGGLAKLGIYLNTAVSAEHNWK